MAVQYPTAHDLLAVSPTVAVVAAIVALLVIPIIASRRTAAIGSVISLIGLLAAFALTFVAPQDHAFQSLIVIDAASLWWQRILLLFVAAELLTPLAALCAAAVVGAEAAASGTAAAADVPDGQSIDSEDALAAVGRLIEAEHQGDAAERAVTTILLSGEFDLRTAFSVLELARAIERATDRFAGFGHMLREHVLADLSS